MIHVVDLRQSIRVLAFVRHFSYLTQTFKSGWRQMPCFQQDKRSFIQDCDFSFLLCLRKAATILKANRNSAQFDPISGSAS